ncbi:MAG: DUF58 domain-containing protein [Chloroflexi bacterium]|nr:DUF58 domain-containing protein [Chloroflexota bacterium]
MAKLSRALPAVSSVALFSRIGVLLLAGVLFWAAWAGAGMLRLLAVTLLVAGGVSYLWSRFSLAGVTQRQHLKESRCFPGESVQLELSLENRKLLPLPWIELEEPYSPGLVPLKASGPGDRLSHFTSLLPYRRSRWQERLLCPRRGYFLIGPSRLTSGDPLGLYRRSQVMDSVLPVVVYPRLLPLPGLELPMRYLLGTRKGPRPSLPDPSLVAGSRDYLPGDPLRHIHWRATARKGRLQVRVMDPSTVQQVVLLFPVDAFRLWEEESFELAASLLASLAHRLVEHRSGVGLLSNTCLVDSREPVFLPPRSGTESLVTILEALAKATPTAHSPFHEFLEGHRSSLPGGVTLVIVAGVVAPWLTPLLGSLRAAGHGVALLLGTPPETEANGWLPSGVACWRFNGADQSRGLVLEPMA